MSSDYYVCVYYNIYVSSDDGFTPQHLAAWSKYSSSKYSSKCSMCPHTAVYVSSDDGFTPQHRACGLILHMCPHTTIHVSSYCYVCVLIPQATGARRCISQQPSDTLFTNILSTSIFTTIFTAGDGCTPLHLAAAFRHSCY